MYVVNRKIDNAVEVNKFFNEIYKGKGKHYRGGLDSSSYTVYQGKKPKHFLHYPPVNGKHTAYRTPQKGYKLVTIEELKALINGCEEVSLYNFNKIIQVACSEWKKKLEDFARKNLDLQTQKLQVSNSFIKEMWKASNKSQEKVVLEVFPNFKGQYEDLVEALNQGKTLQFFNQNNQWQDLNQTEMIGFTYPRDRYRIKPLETYKAFNVQTFKEHRDKWFKSKAMGDYIRCKSYGLFGVKFDSYIISYETLIKEYTFEDGSVCGIKNK